MKKLICLIGAALLLCSCAAQLPQEEETAQTSALPSGLAEIPEAVAYAEMWNESSSPDAPIVQFTSPEELGELLAMLQGVKPDAPAGEPDIPGGVWYYKLYCFDGATVNYAFAANDTVAIGDTWYTYTDDVALSESEVQLTAEGGAEMISYTAENLLREELSISCIPVLERMTEDGWEAVDALIGFCGTLDPLRAGEPVCGNIMRDAFADTPAGTYRLSFQYVADTEERTVSCVLRLPDAANEA